MKTSRPWAGIAFLLALVPLGAAAGNLKVGLGVRVDSLSTSYADKVASTEIIVPLSLSYAFSRDIDVAAKMGWAAASYVNSAPGRSLDKKLSGLTDFSLAANAALGRGAFKPFATARFNAPTGDASWNAYRVMADIPSEYNSGDILGRGLTYGGSLGMKASWTEGEAEVSGGFIKNQSMNPVESDPELDVMPGAVGLVKAVLGIKRDADLRFEATYVSAGATTLDDAPIMRQRNIFIGGVSLAPVFGRLRTVIKVTRSYFGRTQVATENGLGEETRPRLGHRDDVRFDAGIKAGSWNFGAFAGVRKVEANGFRNPDENRYDAGGTGLRQGLSARTKTRLGIMSLGLSHLFVRDLQEAYDADMKLTSVDYRLISSEVSFSHAF